MAKMTDMMEGLKDRSPEAPKATIPKTPSVNSDATRSAPPSILPPIGPRCA
jgi:hypothetical protein